MKLIKIAFALFVIIPLEQFAQEESISVVEIDNLIFKKDNFWRGADGGATIQLKSGKTLWLFSDTFIDEKGTGKRANSKTMIRNSIAIQNTNSINEPLTFYYKGTNRHPDDFFKILGKNWFWTGHGIAVEDKLLVFLIEESAIASSPGFQAVGWYLAIIDNPEANPKNWNINYLEGTNTFGVIVGASAVLQDEKYIYAFGVKEPSTHETYLLRFEKKNLLDGDLSNMEWWTKNGWLDNLKEEPKSSTLFIGQTEFSVHYEPKLKKYIQLQTYGFGKASIGYRLADKLSGPWSEPVVFYKPRLEDEGEFVYTANAHPEFIDDKLVVSYNINNLDFKKLVNNEDIYFPKLICVEFNQSIK